MENRTILESFKNGDDPSIWEDVSNNNLNHNHINTLHGCTRVEVIDQNGRSYVNWNSSNVVNTSMQDNDKTLKIFIYRVEK